MKPLVFDIETSPRPDAEQWLPTIEAPSNYKDPVKIEAYMAEKRAAALERAALSAETASILCVGILADGKPVFIHGDSEGDILRSAWVALEQRGASDVFVTFNGARFDWPMLARRSYLLGVTVPSWFPRDGRWPKRTHVDLFELWQCGDRTESISLDRLARLCGLPGKTDTGARFHVMWQENRQAALDYLRKDLELTRDLFLRIAGNLDRDPASETPQEVPTTASLVQAIKDTLTQRFPGASAEDKAGRIAVIREVFGCSWAEVQQMPPGDLRPRLVALRARLGLGDTAPAKPEEPDEIPMTITPEASVVATPTSELQTAAPVPPSPQPERKVEEKAESEPAPAGDSDVAAAFAAELRKGLGSEENIRLAIGWMVRNKWITGQQATQPDPMQFVPQVKAEKALAAMPRFLTAIGAKV